MKLPPLMLLPLVPALLAGSLLESAIPEGMVLQWSDEFDYTGAPDPAKWTHELGAGGWGNAEVQTYTDSLDNSRVEDGRLIIEVQQDTGTRVPSYTSARLVTRDKADWRYGRIEARAKLPSETGTWAAVWMLAAERLHSEQGWPDNGEIDIVEHVGYEEDPLFLQVKGVDYLDNIHGTLHTYLRNGRDNQGIGDRTYKADASSEYHVYAVNWLEDRIEFEVDGTIFFTVVRADLLPVRNPPDDPWQYWPFDQRFFLILNVAVGGQWGGHFNSNYYPGVSPYLGDGIDHDGVWPQRMEVDYVRVYQQTEYSWKGLETDSAGNADTQSWLGWVNVTNAPWLYSYTLGKYIYPMAALEEVFHTDSQWMFIPNP